MKEWLERLSIDPPSWRQVLSACFGKMITVQMACADRVVKNEDWHVDLEKGVILFADREYHIQFIGSESIDSGTWRWGWENINQFPAAILQLAERTRALGKEWHLKTLTTAEFQLDDDLTGHNLSIVTCGLAQGYCYYRCPHEGGAFFVAVSGVPEEVFVPVDMPHFISVVTQSIGQCELDHRVFVEAFLLWNRTPYDWDGTTLIAHFTQDLGIAFESVGSSLRIASITSL